MLVGCSPSLHFWCSYHNFYSGRQWKYKRDDKRWDQVSLNLCLLTISSFPLSTFFLTFLQLQSWTPVRSHYNLKPNLLHPERKEGRRRNTTPNNINITYPYHIILSPMHYILSVSPSIKLYTKKYINITFTQKLTYYSSSHPFYTWAKRKTNTCVLAHNTSLVVRKGEKLVVWCAQLKSKLVCLSKLMSCYLYFVQCWIILP